MREPETFEEWEDSCYGDYTRKDCYLAGQRSRDAEVGELERALSAWHGTHIESHDGLGSCWKRINSPSGWPRKRLLPNACPTCRKVLGGGV